MEEEEYQEQYQDTVDQLQEFDGSLTKMKAGNFGLLNDLSIMQLV